MRFAILALAVALCGCQTTNETVPVPTATAAPVSLNPTAPGPSSPPIADQMRVIAQVQLSPVEQAAWFNSVRSTLKDPESARFGKTVAGKTAKGVMVVCGWVNAKNSFGGYTGQQPFTGVYMSNQNRFEVLPQDGSEIQQRITLKVCADDGLII
jgi:hypothetical protein